jgi:aspartate oxidase
MDRQVGVLRDETGLRSAIQRFCALLREANSLGGRDAALVSLLIAVSAYSRQESRGAHQRLDYPDMMPGHHTEMTLDQVLRMAAEIDNRTDAPARRVA